MLNRLHILSLIVTMAFLMSCSSSKPALESAGSKPNYSLVYVIHGDASYSYHMDGKRYQADEQALAEAKSVAKNARHGEVFIFHQKPEKKILYLFPQKDRVFYHYKKGQLLKKEKYSPVEGGIAGEAKIYRDIGIPQSGRKVFLYFGHEIPSKTNLPYHQSQPKQVFNTEEFAESLYLFGANFDLTVLSTCNNGNPLMAAELLGKTDFLVASPRNLHLSHLDSHPLELLETTPEIPTHALADSIAHRSFEKLSAFLQTMVTVGVYNLNEMKPYIEELSFTYQQHLLGITQETLFEDNTECNKLEAFHSPLPEQGVELYYKAPAFGRHSKLESHSGWGCKE